MEDINLIQRTKVLEYALTLEVSINTLLQSYLMIVDKHSTRNFGNKAGISFKSKLDLLYDIGVIDKEESNQIELAMNFRNKFLHDIESDSFSYILSTFDSGIKNRFRRYLEPGIVEENEKHYEKAFENLHYSNLKMLQTKYEERRKQINTKKEYTIESLDLITDLSDLSIDFSNEVSKLIESQDLEDEKLRPVIIELTQKCLVFYDSMAKIQERISLNMKLKNELPKHFPF